MDVTDVGRRVREARERLGMSRLQLAKLIGTSHSYIGKLEDGKLTPTVDRLIQVARALKVDPCELISGQRRRWVSAQAEQLARVLEALPSTERELVVRLVNVLYEKAQPDAKAEPYPDGQALE